MSYYNDVAIQFKTQTQANKFIKEYECYLENKPESGNVFGMINSKTINSHKEVIYYWQQKPWNSWKDEIRAVRVLLDTEKYDAIFIRVGEDRGDIVYEEYGKHEIYSPIYLTTPRIAIV